MSKLQRFINTLPDKLNPGYNPILNALLTAWAEQDEEIITQLKNTKAQLFVKTAEGVYLDRLASNFGVVRPSALGLLDEDFQKLIPNLSFKGKQLVRSFYDTMDVFWGPRFTRANVTSTSVGPFDISPGAFFSVMVEGKPCRKITVLKQDVAIPGAMTAEELLRVFSRLDCITAEIITEPGTGDEKINIRTNTPGPRGSLYIEAGSFPALGFPTEQKIGITSIAQRCALYQIDAGEIVIEIPAVLPTLRRTLKGSHHFHETSAIEGAVLPANGVWQGSFLYSRTVKNPFLVTRVKTKLDAGISKGSTMPEIVVEDTSEFPAQGKLILNFGKKNEEQPVSYIAVPNSKTIMIDPGYTFSFSHNVGTEVNLLDPEETRTYSPRKNGADLGVYLTSPANARTIVQEMLTQIAAAGVAVTFVILVPEYIYIKSNPYD